MLATSIAVLRRTEARRPDLIPISGFRDDFAAEKRTFLFVKELAGQRDRSSYNLMTTQFGNRYEKRRTNPATPSSFRRHCSHLSEIRSRSISVTVRATTGPRLSGVRPHAAAWFDEGSFLKKKSPTQFDLTPVSLPVSGRLLTL